MGTRLPGMFLPIHSCLLACSLAEAPATIVPGAAYEQMVRGMGSDVPRDPSDDASSLESSSVGGDADTCSCATAVCSTDTAAPSFAPTIAPTTTHTPTTAPSEIDPRDCVMHPRCVALGFHKRRLDDYMDYGDCTLFYLA